jgi:coenzyme F420-reducing hydrogenase alpha subunit
METDIGLLAQSMIEKPKEEIEQALKQLVRAYDPCFSCSVHLVMT